MATAAAVICEGPFSHFNKWNDEVPQWVVFFADEEENMLEEKKCYRVNSHERAIALAEAIASDRKLEFINNSTND